jgi:hypothetical protein
MARLWRAFSFRANHFQALREFTFSTNELQEFRSDLPSRARNSAAQNWHKAAQNFRDKTSKFKLEHRRNLVRTGIHDPRSLNAAGQIVDATIPVEDDKSLDRLAPGPRTSA